LPRVVIRHLCVAWRYVTAAKPNHCILVTAILDHMPSHTGSHKVALQMPSAKTSTIVDRSGRISGS